MKLLCTMCDYQLGINDLPNWFLMNQQPTPEEKARDHANMTGHVVQVTYTIPPEHKKPEKPCHGFY